MSYPWVGVKLVAGTKKGENQAGRRKRTRV
jgi:hypothetical protein